MKTIAFITPPDADYGFRMTGVPHYIADEASLEGHLANIMDNPEIGLAVIDERLLARSGDEGRLQEERFRELEDQWNGVLLILPSPVKLSAEAEDYAARLIRRAIGYHVKLRI